MSLKRTRGSLIHFKVLFFNEGPLVNFLPLISPLEVPTFPLHDPPTGIQSVKKATAVLPCFIAALRT